MIYGQSEWGDLIQFNVIMIRMKLDLQAITMQWNSNLFFVRIVEAVG